MALTPGQQRCINTLDRSLVVAAGAGSGKTFTLTKRIVHAIQSGAVDGIERVCAITFTNKAAGELKSRIKAELRACGMAEQALKVDEAWVSTIHGMCARILRAHALELDIDPKFQMADATVAARLEARAIDMVLKTAQSGVLEDQPGWPSQAALDALFAEYPARSKGFDGASVEQFLQKLIGIASGNARGFDAFVMPNAAVNPAQLVTTVLESFEALADATLAQKPNEARAAFAAQVAERAVAIRDEMRGPQAADPQWALRAIDSLPLPKKVGTADYKQQVTDAIDLLGTCVMELRLAAARPHLETLVLLAQRASGLFTVLKRHMGVLDNNDLLVLASNALASHDEIAALYTDKFQLVMIDEFQDTDQMQVDMIKRFAGPGACRLCTVGDAQQSIYRFRGADVAVYRRHLEEVRTQNPDDVIMLPDNFRSHPDVLALVDRVFERPQMFGGEFMSLEARRDEARVKRPFVEGVPRVQVQLTTNPYQGVPSDEARAVAAARIADAFAELHARGHSAGEMAVLLGGMTHAEVYAAALRERGLACVISGGSVFSEGAEVAVVADLARVIANPHQTDALFNVLTSPMFELSADDLLVLATKGAEDGAPRRRDLYAGLVSCVRMLRDVDEPDGWSPKLVLAVRVMGGVLDGSGRSTVARVIMRAVVDSGWVFRLQGRGAEGLAGAANIYKAIRMVEQIEQSRASGPSRTAHVFQMLLDESKEAPGALSSTGGDFVRIMTVHASKGLEFPIVAVGEMRATSAQTPCLLACDADGQVMLSLDLKNFLNSLDGAAKSAKPSSLFASLTEDFADEDELLEAARRAQGALQLRAALAERERLGDDEEAKRLLYVALTRAREALVVSLMGKRLKSNPQGTPTSVLGALVPALAGPDGAFEPGVSHFPYGGTMDALVEHVALEPPAEEPAGPPADACASQPASGSPVGARTCAPAPQPGANFPAQPGAASLGEPTSEFPAPFAVPAAVPGVPVSRVPYAPAHDGIFSYSSIAEASHDGDVLDRLADAFCSSVDVPELSGFDADLSAIDHLLDEVASEFDFMPGVRRLNRNAAAVDEDDGSWAYAGSICADADKATDLGTAFHRLAQYAVAARKPGAALEAPPADRVEALARAGNLDDVQRLRLHRALDRWFASDLARDMAAFDDLRAEVPFFVAMPGAGREAVVGGEGGEESFLEGEIDLLALDGARAYDDARVPDDARAYDDARTLDGARAVVVDYKTGGRADESADDLRRKHVLQASCYAYALMRQGIGEVEAIFVRVERPREGDGQPQCVRYRFGANDLPVLEAAIAEVRNR